MKNHIVTMVIVFIGTMFAYDQCESADLILNPGFEALEGKGCRGGTDSPCFWGANYGGFIRDFDPYEGNNHSTFREYTLS